MATLPLAGEDLENKTETEAAKSDAVLETEKKADETKEEVVGYGTIMKVYLI